MPALGTSPACVLWIDEHNRHACPFGFVSDALAKLVKRPVSMSRSLLASNLCLTNALQIFKSNCPVSVLRFFNETLTDNVIGVLLETCLLSRKFFEFAFGGLGLFLLQVLSAMLKDAAVAFNVLPAEILPIRSGGYVHNAEINAKNPININRLRCFNIANSKQVELAFDITQVTFPTLPTQQFQLPCTSREGNTLPTVYRPDRNFLRFQFVGKNAIIKGDCPVWLERPLCLAVNPIGIGDLRDATDNYLRCQLEHLLDVVIGEFMQGKLTKGFVFPRLITDVVASSIRHFKSFMKRARLFGRWKEFQLSNQFHISSVSLFQYIDKWLWAKAAKAGAFLPAVKRAGFPALKGKRS